MNAFLVMVSLALWLFGVNDLMANDAPVRSVGKAIGPLEGVPVRMVSEEIRITLDNNIAHVSCLFKLRNEGPIDTILVGFPRGWEKDLYDFRAWTSRGDLSIEEGASAPVYGGEGDEGIKWWKTFRLPLPTTGDTVQVRNYYWTVLSQIDNRTLTDQYFSYVLRTGALWRGEIGDARITVDFRNTHPEQITRLSPEGYARQGQRVEWHFQHLEPSEDISVNIMQDFLFDRWTRALELIEQNPDSSEGHFLLGTYYFNREQPPRKRAVGEFLKAISINPEMWDARWYLAAELYFQNDRVGARDQVESIVRGNPQYRCVDEALPIEVYADIPDIPQIFLKNLKE